MKEEVKNYGSIGDCPVCGQGRQVVSRWNNTHKLVVYCEECETLWPTPLDALYNRNSFRNDSGERGQLTMLTKINPWETQVFVVQLVEYVPQLRDLLSEHLKDYDELLPHVFFGDLTRYVVDQVKKGTTSSYEPVQRVLIFFEDGLKSGDKDIENLIMASFIENLADETEVKNKLKELSGPNLAKKLEK